MKLLSKSRFKLGLECPNKLFFTGKKEYANKKSEDTFMMALAQGGFQVEELARLHYPNGIFINTAPYEYEKAVELTTEALKAENAIIYEAAFMVDGFFIRTDILIKTGNKVRLIEVKAKSFDPNDEHTFIGKGGGLTNKWKPYLFDLAFQKEVAQRAYPDFTIEAYLMLADRTKKASIDGLNQFFRIPAKGNPRTDIIKRVSKLDQIGNAVLSEVNVDNIIDDIIADKHKYHKNLGFKEALQQFKMAYIEDRYFNWNTNFTACKNCEFKTNAEQKANGMLSGFEHCFKKQHNWTEGDFKKPNAFEVWNFRGKSLLEENRLLMENLFEEDFDVTVLPDKLSPSERRWLQVEKSQQNDTSIYVEKIGLKTEMDNWVFPLHFIDFETSTVALPFTAGTRPYEQVAFQFSHHIYQQDGAIEHKSEFISNTAGEFPNFIFVRNLKKALENDNGTIFRFGSHENSILNAIIIQLTESDQKDKLELIAFIKTITNSTKKNATSWEGERNMVDINNLVKEFYYNPYTKGSNSIKAILPAALNSSNFLREKYSQAIGSINITSKNFAPDHIWLKTEGDEIVNPYKMLPPIFEGWSELEILDNLSDIENIADGGAALTAYSKLQFQDMTEKERAEITQGLLKYCELDTLAMVMIYEHFTELI